MSSSVFFTPGIQIMDRLSFRKKILFLAVVFLVPVAWLMTMYISEHLSLIQFSEKERVGANYLKTIFPVIKNSAKIRGLTNAYLNGNQAVKPELDKTVETVSSLLVSIAAKESDIQKKLTGLRSIKPLQLKWQTLSQNASRGAVEDFSDYSLFITALHKYILHIADVSNLTLDPDLDSFYLIKMIIVNLPVVTDRIGQARGLGAGVAAKQKFTPAEFAGLTALVNEIKLFGEGVRDSLAKVYEQSPSLKKLLAGYERDFKQQWQAFKQLSEAKLLAPASIQIESGAYFKTGTETLKSSYTLLNKALPVLTTLIDNRIQRKKNNMYQAVATMVLILLLSGYLFQGFANSVKNNLDTINAAVSALSSGNFQVKAEVKSHDEIGTSAANLNEMIVKVRELITRVVDSARLVEGVAEQVSQSAEQAQDGINQQNSEIEQVATAINEMSATVHEVAQNTSNAAELTQTADEEANNGRQVVSETIDTINHLASEMQSSSQVIQDLETQSESIGTVLDVIRGIAEQTNLLALNAAIEAARAGEQGRGFAVVADEVRTLASRTQESTEEINDMIGKLQTGARNAVSAMNLGTTQTEKSVEQAVQAGAALDQISSAVTTIRDMNTQIASAAEEQSSVSEEINRNIVNIRDIAEATVEGANQTAQSSTQMSQVATELIDLVNEFKI